LFRHLIAETDHHSLIRPGDKHLRIDDALNRCHSCCSAKRIEKCSNATIAAKAPHEVAGLSFRRRHCCWAGMKRAWLRGRCLYPPQEADILVSEGLASFFETVDIHVCGNEHPQTSA
jgi:hypothetical protein